MYSIYSSKSKLKNLINPISTKHLNIDYKFKLLKYLIKITLLNYHTLLNAFRTQESQRNHTHDIIIISLQSEKVLIPWFKFYIHQYFIVILIHPAFHFLNFLI